MTDKPRAKVSPAESRPSGQTGPHRPVAPRRGFVGVLGLLYPSRPALRLLPRPSTTEG